MVTVRVCSKLKTSWNLVLFTNKVGKISRYFEGFFIKTIIPLALVGYEMIIANSALRASLATYYLMSNAPRGTTVNLAAFFAVKIKNLLMNNKITLSKTTIAIRFVLSLLWYLF